MKKSFNSPRGKNSMAAGMRARHRYRQRYKRVKEVRKEQVGRWQSKGGWGLNVRAWKRGCSRVASLFRSQLVFRGCPWPNRGRESARALFLQQDQPGVEKHPGNIIPHRRPVYQKRQTLKYSWNKLSSDRVALRLRLCPTLALDGPYCLPCVTRAHSPRLYLFSSHASSPTPKRTVRRGSSSFAPSCLRFYRWTSIISTHSNFPLHRYRGWFFRRLIHKCKIFLSDLTVTE